MIRALVLIFLRHSIISSFTTKIQPSLIIHALSVTGEECSSTINKRPIISLRKIGLTVWNLFITKAGLEITVDHRILIDREQILSDGNSLSSDTMTEGEFLGKRKG